MKLTKSLLKQTVKLCKDVYYHPSMVKGKVSASVCVIDGVQYLAFTGSENLSNWFSNLMVYKTERHWFKGKAHKGFVEAFEALRSPIMERLTQSPVLVSGHSLGGSMAVLATVYLRYCGYQVDACVTYGKPRVGDLEFKDAYNSNGVPTWRVVNGQDGVPTLPKFGYHHEGVSVVIDDDKLSSYKLARTTGRFLKDIIGMGHEHLIDDYYKDIYTSTWSFPDEN